MSSEKNSISTNKPCLLTHIGAPLPGIPNFHDNKSKAVTFSNKMLGLVLFQADSRSMTEE